ncbi:hypothetical protein J3R30DRAFT_3403753 [Lentinula aciculospora]|uniref:K Homology domain-containing protein n=1 Tax=Lentinula aciculospora TaxID=153920 RepID=A0A9W9DPF4_9AGAR|nr:hypothetical protein J3R30DRAFT_3403753 [Lentinula aciculospora]
MSASLDVLSVKIDTLINTLSEVAVTLRSTTTIPTATPVPKKKGKKAAPTPAATSSAPVNAQLCLPTTSADLEKLTIQVSVPDASAGHLVGRAGAGLKQIHDFSCARISVPPSGSSGAQLVTIRGSRCEVGDALVAIGKRLAGRRVHVNRLVKKTDTKGKAPALSPNPPPTTTGTRPSTTSVVIVQIDDPDAARTNVGFYTGWDCTTLSYVGLSTDSSTNDGADLTNGHKWLVVPDHLAEVEDDEGEVKANSRTSCLLASVLVSITDLFVIAFDPQLYCRLDSYFVYKMNPSWSSEMGLISSSDEQKHPVQTFINLLNTDTFDIHFIDVLSMLH